MPEQPPAITDEALAQAIKDLEGLAQAEYGMTLDELFADDTPVKGRTTAENRGVRETRDAVWRVGRLVGITVKEPFADPVDPRVRPHSQTPELRNWSSQTGASRAWVLTPPEAPRPELWQYRLLQGFLREEKPIGELDWLPPRMEPEVARVAMFLREAQSERGLFRAITLGARRYLCKNDTEVGAAVASAVGAPAVKGRITVAPAQTLAQGGFQSAAQAMAIAVPWLDPTMVPLIAGLLLVIVARGLDVYCTRVLPAPITYVAET
ncbi:hypothetical protein [Streptomyces sp. NBC_00648]|uniref:hypothetical protein n=1 Tax=Streptomyces sp. NBC_00648 TaxID=2975797 RepID=UPI003243EDC6